MARKPRKQPAAPLPADQTVPPVDTSSPPDTVVEEPTPETKPDPAKVTAELKVETF